MIDGGRASFEEAGFSLLELLVGAAIFTLLLAIALVLFGSAQRSYKIGVNLTEEQQSTRVAFGRLSSDIRVAGFNVNPDGDDSRVDEAIEGAWDTALTLRGDFDFADRAASASPESSLAGTAYGLVSTGNDEILTYVLAKPGPSGPDHLDLRLDADRPRSKTVRTVRIPNVALVQDDPPYTLYRVTLADVAGPFPGAPQAAGDFVFEPVADNIRSLTFRYLASSGEMLGPGTPADPADDLGGGDATVAARSRIRRIAVRLVGMTEDEDPDYVDVDDAGPGVHYRKFEMVSSITPENLGRRGSKDLGSAAPPPGP